MALGRLQATPQPPQLEALPAMSCSQPSWTVPSQSAKPGLHEAMVHAPAAQEPVAWAGLHTAPQAPQLVASAAMLVSQPSAALPLQSAKPALQLAMPQAPALHGGVA